MKLKICGMKDINNIASVAKYTPDYMGFIFYKESKRFVENLNPNAVKGLSPCIKRVGVFVNESLDTVLKIRDTYELDFVQLHGNETINYCLALKAFNIPIIKAFGIDTTTKFSTINTFSETCDYFLFDTKTDKYGGSGKKFDWQLLSNHLWQRPIFLSGGIDLEDIHQILQLPFHLHGIDVNSQFETEPGIKDENKIKELVKIII